VLVQWIGPQETVTLGTSMGTTDAERWIVSLHFPQKKLKGA
jgi:hypothetical protein